MQQGRKRQLVPLNVPPGLVLDVTESAAAGRWRDGENVRFRKVNNKFFVEKIGGFRKHLGAKLKGSCRQIVAWGALDNRTLRAYGTNQRLYVEVDGTLEDKTPLKDQATRNGPLTTSVGTKRIVVNFGRSHGCSVGDWVVLTPAADVGGLPVAALTGDFEVTEVVSSNTFAVEALNDALSTATGGGSTKIELLWPTGPDDNIYGNGWGAGGWGRMGWGDGAEDDILSARVAIWSLSKWGQDVFGVRRGTPIFTWSPSLPMARASRLDKDPKAAHAPVIAEFVVCDQNKGHILAFGCDEYLGNGAQNPVHFRWSELLNPYSWRADSETVSGGLTFDKGSRIKAVVQMEEAIMVFTDAALYAVRYGGGKYTYGYKLIAENVDIVGPNAAVNYDGVMMWVGEKGVYRFAGQGVEKVQSDIDGWLQDNTNWEQGDKINGGVNVKFREIWWSLPSKDSNECDLAIIWSMDTQTFSKTSFGRTAWYGGPMASSPLACGSNFVFEQENGWDDATGDDTVALDAWVESADIEIGDGTDVMFCDLVVYDIDFRRTALSDGELVHTFKVKDWPSTTNHKEVEETAKKVVSLKYEYTRKKSLRLRGRALSIRVGSTKTGCSWTLGVPRVRMRTDGER